MVANQLSTKTLILPLATIKLLLSQFQVGRDIVYLLYPSDFN